MLASENDDNVPHARDSQLVSARRVLSAGRRQKVMMRLANPSSVLLAGISCATALVARRGEGKGEEAVLT